MKHQLQKQLYVVTVIAIASSNAQSTIIVNDGLDHTTAGAINKLKSPPKAYDFKFNFLQPTTAPTNNPTTETAFSAPATLTLVGVGLIGIGLTRKKRNSCKARQKNLQ
ncbi:MAG: PEP-CTERM sorting domain-containing protein [Methylococcales bacterium]